MRSEVVTGDVTGIDEVTGLPIVHNDGGFDNDDSYSDEDLLDEDLLDVSPKPKGKRAPDNESSILLNTKIDRMYEIAKHYGIANFKRLGRAVLYNTIY